MQHWQAAIFGPLMVDGCFLRSREIVCEVKDLVQHAVFISNIFQ